MCASITGDVLRFPLVFKNISKPIFDILELDGGENVKEQYNECIKTEIWQWER